MAISSLSGVYTGFDVSESILPNLMKQTRTHFFAYFECVAEVRERPDSQNTT